MGHDHMGERDEAGTLWFVSTSGRFTKVINGMSSTSRKEKKMVKLPIGKKELKSRFLEEAEESKRLTQTPLVSGEKKEVLPKEPHKLDMTAFQKPPESQGSTEISTERGPEAPSEILESFEPGIKKSWRVEKATDIITNVLHIYYFGLAESRWQAEKIVAALEKEHLLCALVEPPKP